MYLVSEMENSPRAWCTPPGNTCIGNETAIRHSQMTICGRQLSVISHSDIYSVRKEIQERVYIIFREKGI